MVREKLEFGNIDHTFPNYNKDWVSKIIGQSRTRPRFVSEIHERRWNRMWVKEAKRLGMEYIHGQNRFDKRSGDSGYLRGKSLDSGDDEMSDILRRYDAVVSGYNERYAEPAEKESDSSLYGLLAEVDVELRL